MSVRNLVLGTALGYDFKKVAPFVLSLREAGYQGEIALIVGTLDPLSRMALAKHDVKLISERDPEMRDESLALALGSDLDVVSQLHLQTKRFLIYLRYLALHEGETGEVLLSDVRDVFFQRDPFDYPHDPETLSCAMEERTIGDCEVNGPWVLEAGGQETLDSLGGFNVSCSGTTIGSYRSLRNYLTQMVALILKNPTPVRGVDQGFHNCVIYGGSIPNLNFCSNRDGPFLTAHGVYDWTLDASGEVRLPGGRIANIVHQFNRHPELVSLAKRRFRPSPLLSAALRAIRPLRRLARR